MEHKQTPPGPTAHTPFKQTFFHGTKADLRVGEFLDAGYPSNFGQNKSAKHIYFTATLDAAVWGAELALGTERQRIYLVEPTGTFEDDPNLTNNKFPGNPSLSYRSTDPVRVVGELMLWQGHPEDQVRHMQESVAKLYEAGIGAIED